MKVQLVVVQGKPEGMVIPLSSPKYKIGRGEGCQLRPNSDLVSREHAQFVVGTDSVLVQDLGSRNGTEVNGRRLAANQPQILKAGDLIKVGTLTFAISIEGIPASKAMTIAPGGRKPSLDDVSGDEIDAWLVSDESRPTPDRPSGVYGGDTITLATYQGQERAKPAPEPARPAAPVPAARQEPVAAVPPLKPVTPSPVASAPPSPPLVASPPPVPVPVNVAPAPIVPPIVAAPAPILVEPPIVAAMLSSTSAPVSTPPPAAEPDPEREFFNPLFNFLSDSPDLPDAEPEATDNSGPTEARAGDDGIADLSSLQDDESDEGDAGAPAPEDFIDESNPFYVKKPESPAANKPAAGSADSSSAAGDILRKLMDRKRAR